ncbi:MAG: SIS domain-containing protein [Bdellovibrio sp.]
MSQSFPLKQNWWFQNLQEAHSLLGGLLQDSQFLDSCQRMSQILISCYQQGGKVFSCGNGGSHCDALHFSEELTGRYRKNRRPLGALALGEGPHTTCVANDYGFEFVFSRQLEGLARKGDVLLTLSTSGQSPNILRALESARQLGITSIALLGRDGGKAKNLADLSLIVPAQTSDRIQEVHIKLLHIAIETVERELFPQNYLD